MKEGNRPRWIVPLKFLRLIIYGNDSRNPLLVSEVPSL